MATINTLITDFLEDLENKKKRSLRTVRNYDFYLRRFSCWAKKKKISDPEKITEQVVKRYRLWLDKIESSVKKAKLKLNTQTYHLIALRNYLKYLETEKINSLSPKKVKLPRLVQTKVEYLEVPEIQDLFGAPILVKQHKLFQARDRAILELLYCTGLKVSEVARLTIHDLDLKKGLIMSAKRKITLTNQAKHWLQQYIKFRKKVDNEYLFIGHDRALHARKPKALTPRSVERIVKKYAQVADIEKKVTPQTLRHTYAINLIKKGDKIENIKKKLGYSVISSTLKYFEK
ncbi:tyrosine-type recombinase/integrase [Candidatus Kuenenbacteria bacterium]|nr:tyrosine-type recombinase/integrase [Candidatus Kuenenbacteria bacterium]